ncbi:MAG: porin family protein [Bacteroidales bacterium]|nr:porin family protein [Bacteroidales bacterium]MDD4683604.1 porin family protein [Bacteroidales bacterium]
MKKTILILAATFLLATNLSAQIGNGSDSRDNLRFGVKAGMNLSNMYDSKNEQYDADTKVGFVGGVFISIPIVGKVIGIQPEVLFSQKGFSASTNYPLIGEISFTRTTNYLDIPIFLAFKPIENLTILAGPQYSYLFKQIDNFKGLGANNSVVTDFENENIRKNTFSLAIGADLNFNYFVVGIRGGWDLTNNNGNGTSDTPRYKNAWGGLTVGFRL